MPVRAADPYPPRPAYSGGDDAEWAAFHAAVVVDLAPAGLIEREFATILARNLWRLRDAERQKSARGRRKRLAQVDADEQTVQALLSLFRPLDGGKGDRPHLSAVRFAVRRLPTIKADMRAGLDLAPDVRQLRDERRAKEAATFRDSSFGNFRLRGQDPFVR